jgi:hypothetical protein
MLRPWLVVLALVLAPRIAAARDPLDLVCAGIAKPTDDAEQVGVSINYHDSRAPDGTSRKIALRELWGDLVFSWKAVGGADLDKPVAIVLESGKLVRFRGTYTLSKSGADFVLRLVGKLSRHPLSDKALHPIDATLRCIDISI